MQLHPQAGLSHRADGATIGLLAITYLDYHFITPEQAGFVYHIPVFQQHLVPVQRLEWGKHNLIRPFPYLLHEHGTIQLDTQPPTLPYRIERITFVPPQKVPPFIEETTPSGQKFRRHLAT